MQAAGAPAALTCVPTNEHQLQRRMIMMNRIVLTIFLTIATLAAIPASAGPYCQEDLGYGRTSSFGCGG
jgi:hypothetical protein